MTQTSENTDSYTLTRFNALSHGVLSLYTVLPWENQDEYGQLIAALVAEHVPREPTEEHLIEEIAGVFWRKRRLWLGEAAIHRERLRNSVDEYSDTAKSALAHLGETEECESVADALRATDADTAEAIAGVDGTIATVTRAMETLCGTDEAAYHPALASLPEETQEWWAESIKPKSRARGEDGKHYKAELGSLQLFLQDEVMPWLLRYRVQLENRPLVREQVFGEATDPDKLERLGR